MLPPHGGNLLKVLFSLCFAVLAASAKADPYFSILDLNHPHISAGAFVDVENAGQSSAGSMLAVVYHKADSGCELQSFGCFDWAPLTIGFSANGGETLLALAPTVNLAPIAKAGILSIVNGLTGEGQLSGLKSSLESEPIGGAAPTIAFGPAWVVSPTRAWKGAFRIFAGAAWAF